MHAELASPARHNIGGSSPTIEKCTSRRHFASVAGPPHASSVCCHCVVLDHIISPEQIQKDPEGTREVSNSSLFGTK